MANYLLEERKQLQAAIKSILEAGQEFQTRDGRVRQANLDKLYKRLDAVNAALSDSDSMTDTVLLRYDGR